MADIEELARLTIDCGLRLHKDLGPGLLESVYEAVLASSLAKRGLKADRQVPIGIEYDGLAFAEGFRADLLVEDRLIVEVKSVDRLMPVHGKQLLTYSSPDPSAPWRSSELRWSNISGGNQARRQ